MPFLVDQIIFDGPYKDFDFFKNISGVYMLAVENESNYNPIEIGKSEDIGQYLTTHSELEYWNSLELEISVFVNPAKIHPFLANDNIEKISSISLAPAA